jgi:hypothetical protein
LQNYLETFAEFAISRGFLLIWRNFVKFLLLCPETGGESCGGGGGGGGGQHTAEQDESSTQLRGGKCTTSPKSTDVKI